ncbi:MAG TPA: hypothetical protein VGW12_07165 [Pyrinomonadaceae bacterium]|nr:hypothetical protein [Pyrinomonadaceae bacterium]
MNQKILRGCVLLVSVCLLSLVSVSAQQRARRGGLDNLSLPSTTARVAASTQPGASAWQTFAPDGAGFSISLPGMPEEATRAGRESGQLNGGLRSYRLTAGGVKFEVSRTGQLPEELFNQPGASDKFFTGASQGITMALARSNAQIKFKLASEEAVSLDGYEGREYEFEADGHYSVARIFLVERTVFALSIIGPRSEATPETVRRFLDSFALTQ